MENPANSSSRVRIQKYIASCGYCSRRKAELLVEHGLVEVNGKVVESLGTKIRPDVDVVAINRERIEPPEPLSIMLNKPSGFITSTHDTHERLTVLDLLPRSIRELGVLPAGRLDLETEGLLILTNVGDLQHQITHPRYSCEKEYRAKLSRRPDPGEVEKLRRGVFLSEVGKKTQAAEIEVDGKVARVVIGEGMKRQVRRMFEVVGIHVTYLERVRIGRVELGDLRRGGWRRLSEDEVEALIESSGP